MVTKKILPRIWDYAIITFGLLVFTFSWVAFIIPNEIVGGGVSGISALVLYATGIKFEYTYFFVNIALFILGVKILGKQFGIKTLYCIIASSLFFRYLPYIIPDVLIEQVQEEKNLFLWVIVGGVLEGVGIGIAFTRGGNSGGTDIIAFIINKYKHINPGRIILYCDIIIIGSSIFLPDRTILSVLYGFIMIAVSTYVIDMLIVGSKQSMQIFIFSEKQKEIADRIMEVTDRGVTMVHSTGWYTKKEKDVILVVVRKYEVTTVYRIVKEIDPSAFISTSSATGVYGEGFDPIKDGKVFKKKKGD
ncbi:MAG: YitT family protein [Prevotellaceae bacterium]|jgi:uncharacterized membrane-anchored protein YitT (DUF2179 family)|nr:YitT family protein [Prevotellaceae bacterium]